MRPILALIAPVLAAAAAYALNLPQSYGAHPWWSGTVILIGVPVGLLVALALTRLSIPKPAKMVLVALATLSAMGIASTGKARFAASYAEDTFGGQMWYFGWIAICAFAAALIATALWPQRETH